VLDDGVTVAERQAEAERRETARIRRCEERARRRQLVDRKRRRC